MDPNDPFVTMNVPDNLNSSLQGYVDLYQDAVLNNINSDPRKFDTTKPCLVCGEVGHTFENCSILNNIPLLQRHYISWKLYLAREQKRQQEAQINQLEVQLTNSSFEVLDDDIPTYETMNEEDFQEGDY